MLVAFAKFVPEIVTGAPSGPVAGSKALIVGGGGITTKLDALAAKPPGVVTAMLPVVAPAGTRAMICKAVSELIVVAGAPPNVTLLAFERFVPLIVTLVPTTPLLGEKLPTVGGWITVKAVALDVEPPGVVTDMRPLVVPEDTLAII